MSYPLHGPACVVLQGTKSEAVIAEQVEMVMQQVDQNQDSKISKEEFFKWVSMITKVRAWGHTKGGPDMAPGHFPIKHTQAGASSCSRADGDGMLCFICITTRSSHRSQSAV